MLDLSTFFFLTSLLFFLLWIEKGGCQYGFMQEYYFTVPSPVSYQDVLLEVDTRTLMSTPLVEANQTLMLEDCFDMKFVYFREYEERSGPVWLEYFIESNCGKMETQIWVRLNISEQLEVAKNYSIWMFYGADRSGLVDSETEDLYPAEQLTKLEKKFGGFMFLQANEDECRFESSEALALSGKFLRISDIERAGEVGYSTSHSHSSDLNADVPTLSTILCRQPVSGGSEWGCPPDIHHPLDVASITLEDKDWVEILDTINFRPCISNAEKEMIYTIPKDIVVFWDDGGSVPTGYAMYSNPAATGSLKKLIRYDDTWWESESSGGDVLKHTHTNSGDTTPKLLQIYAQDDEYAVQSNGGDGLFWWQSQNHYHNLVPFPGWTEGDMVGSHLPEVVDLIMLVNQVENFTLPSGSILPMKSSSSVEDIVGWEKVLHSNEDRYVRFNDVNPLTLTGAGNHYHSMNDYSSAPIGTAPKCYDNSSYYDASRSFMESVSASHVHQVTIFAGNLPNVPAYSMHVFLKKKFSPPVELGETEILKFECFGLDRFHPDSCNFQNGWGRCVSWDTCKCKDKPYEVETASGERVTATIIGRVCSEFVSGAYYVDDESIAVDYIADIGLITQVSRQMENKFDCGLVLKNPNDVVDDYDENPKKNCNWEAESLLKTARLNIKGTRSGLTTIDIISFSNQRFLTLTVDPLESDDAWWIVAVVVPIVLALLLLIGIGVLLAVLLFGLAAYQKKKLKKFENLDVEMLLKEQQAEVVDDNTAKLNIDQNLFEVNFKDIKIEKKIGEGGSNSVVFVATWEGLKVAFKCFKTQHICSDQNRFNEFEKEVSILSSVKHPNVLRFFGATLHPPRVGILMEFCENGDLKVFLETYRDENAQEYDFFERVRMMKEVASAMMFLHSSKIIHRDLKSENILVTTDFATKVMDFGLSKVVERISMTQTKRVGTSIYMAPEVTRGDQYSEKCDVFSFGMILYEVLHYNFDPYKAVAKSFNLEFKVASNPLFRPSIRMKKFTGEEWLVSLMKSSWADRPQERKSFKAIVETFTTKKNSFVSKLPKRRGSSVNSSNMSKEIERLKRVLEREQHDQMKLKFDFKRLSQRFPAKDGRRDSRKLQNTKVKTPNIPMSVNNVSRKTPNKSTRGSVQLGRKAKNIPHIPHLPNKGGSRGSAKGLLGKVRKGSIRKNPIPKPPNKVESGSVKDLQRNSGRLRKGSFGNRK